VIDCNFRGRHFFSRRTGEYVHTRAQRQAQMHPPPPSFCMNVKRKELQKKHFVND
jgi:hypothetical protein